MVKWLILIGALFFSMNVFADDATPEDIESAYNYFSQISGDATTGPVSSKPQLPSRHVENAKQPPSLGGVAADLMQPVSVVARFLYSMAIIIGLTCLFGAFVRYTQYRVNPLAHPIGTVVTLLILGIVLLLLPLLYKVTESGIPPSS